MKKKYFKPASTIYKVNTANCILAGSLDVKDEEFDPNKGIGAAEYEELEDDYGY